MGLAKNQESRQCLWDPYSFWTPEASQVEYMTKALLACVTVFLVHKTAKRNVYCKSHALCMQRTCTDHLLRAYALHGLTTQFFPWLEQVRRATCTWQVLCQYSYPNSPPDSSRRGVSYQTLQSMHVENTYGRLRVRLNVYMRKIRAATNPSPFLLKVVLYEPLLSSWVPCCLRDVSVYTAGCEWTCQLRNCGFQINHLRIQVGYSQKPFWSMIDLPSLSIP